MIIRFSTGLYKSVLPSTPQDAGNITFVISNTTPPRTNLVFPKIPAGLADLGRFHDQPLSGLDNRRFLGELIFNVSAARRSLTGNNSKQYEIGQVLEFTDVDNKTVEPMLVNQVTQIQHNTNVLDYEAMGITGEEQDLIASESFRMLAELTDQLNAAKQLRADAEIKVNLQQKIVNETTKTIEALSVIGGAGLGPLLDKLRDTRQSAFAARDAAIVEANDAAAAADVLVGKLRTVATIVK